MLSEPESSCSESSRADKETRARMKDAGANLFMRKPFVIAKLVDRVGKMLTARAGLR